MSKIVLDTNFIIALLDAKDIHHKKAESLIRNIENNNNFLIMDCILNEVFSVLARRCREKGVKFSDIAGTVRLKLDLFTKIDSYSEVGRLHEDILDSIIKHEGIINYHDILIAFIMKEKKIKDIITFDKGFKNFNWLNVISS